MAFISFRPFRLSTLSLPVLGALPLLGCFQGRVLALLSIAAVSALPVNAIASVALAKQMYATTNPAAFYSTTPNPAGFNSPTLKQTLTQKHISEKVPHYFEKNNGQHPRDFHFVAKTAFSQFAFADNRVVIQLRDKSKENKPYHQFSLLFEGAQPSPSISANKKSQYKVHYYRGKKSQWRKNIDTFSEIVYHDIYPNIDLKFYFNDQRLEYDFIVKPGTDPSIIRFSYENINNISIATDDTLEILVSSGLVKQKAPVIYQWSDDKKQKLFIQGAYVNNNSTITAHKENSFSFTLANYDKKKELIIDPVIEFSSYFGGNWEDNATTVATDSVGNIFLVGSTSAQARITVNNIMTLENEPLAPQDYVWEASTYDGTHGISLGAEYANGSSLDLNTEDYACDYRYDGYFKRDYMVTDYDGFISKFDANQNLLYTTYYGGCRNDGIRDMVVVNDNVYVAGFTLSDNLPSVNEVQSARAPSRFTTEPVQSDAFYAKFDNDGILIFSSYLGGDGRDGARAIAVDSNENLYITGYTHSTDLTSCSLSDKNVIGCKNIGGVELVTEIAGGQETSLYSDAFVAKISPTGDGIGFITYFGGSLDDWGQSIIVRDNAADPLQNGIYISGNTASPDLPTRSTGYSLLNYQTNTRTCSRLGVVDASVRASDAHVCEDVYLAKISMDGTELMFSTYLGGKRDDNVSDMEIDHLGNIYLFGTSKSQGARFEFNTILPPLVNNATSEQILQYQEDNAGIIGLLNNRFPLYKNIPELGFDNASTSAMAFLSVLNADANALVLSTFIGGSGEDAGLSVELNDDGVSPNIDVYVGGHTLSDDFYTKLAFQKTTSNSDLYIIKLAMDLTKANDLYDIPVCSDPNDDSTCANPAGSTCNNAACDLYDIRYSTLIGGENLDALKDMHYSAFDGGLFLAGTTYSTLFPVTGNALKTQIAEAFIKNYNPLTRALEFKASYYPSEMFLMKLSDTDVSTDWKIDVNLLTDGVIKEGEKIRYEINLSRNAGSNSIGLTSARIVLRFPYLAATESMSQYASVTNADNCVMEYQQIYCTLGDLGTADIKTLAVTLLPRVTGDFPVNFSLMSLTGDTDMSNNSQDVTVRIKASPSRGALNIWFIVFLFIVFRFLVRRVSILH